MKRGQKATRIQGVYNLARASKNTEKTKNNKKPTSPYMAAIHSKDPIRDNDLSPLYILAHPHNIQTKEFFNFCISNTPPPPKSKPISFLPKSPKDVQRYRLPYLFPFFPYKRAPLA